MKIADLIRKKRRGLGMSQAHLAGLIGFKCKQNISAIENGRRQISKAKLISVSRALGLSRASMTLIFLEEERQKIKHKLMGF